MTTLFWRERKDSGLKWLNNFLRANILTGFKKPVRYKKICQNHYKYLKLIPHRFLESVRIKIEYII